MSALAEALLAAQRQAIAAMGKPYIAGAIEGTEVRVRLEAIGCTDPVDTDRLMHAWSILSEYGAPAPPASNGAPASTESRPASEAQWKLIRRLADERGQVAPDGPLTVEQASQVIEGLRKAGT